MKTIKQTIVSIFILVIGWQTLNGQVYVQKGTDIDGEYAEDRSGYSVSMPDSNTIAVGAIGNGAWSGHVRIYDWINAAWVQRGLDIIGEWAHDNSGHAVSMPDANTVAIGSPRNDDNGSNSGQVRVYEWDGAAWVQKGADIEGEAHLNNSGQSVSMPNANTVAIGAYLNSHNLVYNAGHVRVFKWTGSTWVQKGMDIDGDAYNDHSGWSVSMPDVNTVAIGAPNNDDNGNNSGQARVFKWSGSAWVQKGNDIDGESASDHSGRSVSMPDANTLAIGAIGNGGGGHARIYIWNGSAWLQKGTDIDAEAFGDRYGVSISMPDAQTVAIGGDLNDGAGGEAGHTRIYLCTATTSTISPTYCNSYVSPSANHTWTTSGTYLDTIANAIGCDSIITINLTINNGTYSSISPVACDNYISPSGNYIWISSGAYEDTIANMAGCDSVITIALTINSTTAKNISPTACISYASPSGNNVWTSSGTYTDTIQNSSGCDSVITINLTVNAVDTTVTKTSPTLAANDTSATHKWLNCDSNFTAITGEIDHSFTASLNGYYAVEITANNGCIDTSDCHEIINASITENYFGERLRLYPNPTNGQFTVDLGNLYSEIFVIVRSAQGDEVSRKGYSSGQLLNMELEAAHGIYFVEIISETQNKRAMLKVLLE